MKNLLKYLGLLVVVAVTNLGITAYAETIVRSTTEITHFKKHNVCPSTHTYSTSCPGYVVDHAMPLCLGGSDKEDNMQYQEYKDSLKKDAAEKTICAYYAKFKKSKAASNPLN